MDTRALSSLRVLLRTFPSSHYALLSLFLFIGLELLFIVHRWLPLLLSILLAVLIMGIILIRSEEGDQFHPTQTILPTIAAFGFAALAVYLPLTFFIHIYFILCATAFFFILKYGAKQAWPTWNTVISLAVLTTAVAPIIGWRFTLYSPVWAMIALLFPVIALMAFQSLLRYTPRMSEAGFIALAIAFVLSEFIWVLQFLPLHFIVQTGCVVAVYYTILHSITGVYEKSMNRQRALEYAVVGAIALALLLFTARWS
jgi:hypothetical protein